MNRAELVALVQNLKSHGLTSSTDKLLAVVLAFCDAENIPLQQCEIVNILDLNKQNCLDSLGRLVEKKLIKTITSGKRAVFYVPLPDIEDCQVSSKDSPISHR